MNKLGIPWKVKRIRLPHEQGTCGVPECCYDLLVGDQCYIPDTENPRLATLMICSKICLEALEKKVA